MDPARITGPRTPGVPEVSGVAGAEIIGVGPSADGGTVFDVALPPAGRPDASVVSVPSSAPAGADPGRPVASLSSVAARVVPAGEGVHRLVFVPGLATAGEVAAALAAVPASAVFMGGSIGPETAEADFVELADPGPWPDLPDLALWPGGSGRVLRGTTGSGKSDMADAVEAPAGASRGGA